MEELYHMKKIKLKIKKTISTVVLSSLLIMMLLSGCATSSGENATESSSEVNDTTLNVDKSTDLFTDRDSQTDYDQNEAITLNFNGSTAVTTSELVGIDGSTITITKEGTYILSGDLNNGQVIVDATINDKIQLVLQGVTMNSDNSAPIFIKQADKVFITLAEGTDNYLTTMGEFVSSDEDNVDSVIYSKDDLTLNGEGSLTISTDSGHGIVSKDDLVITSGNYNITSKVHGLVGKDSVRVLDGAFLIVSDEDGIHSNNDEDTSLGFVYIAGGTIEITSGDDGIHANTNVTISGGTININESYEGIEGQSINIEGGIVNVAASDDGLNAAGGNDSSAFNNGQKMDMFTADADCYITISGGILNVNASGDGVDSNGNLYVSGGETYVSGPTNNGNGSLDYNGSATITGGVFIAAGSSGMAQNFGTDSTQGSILINSTQSQNSSITLTDSEGALLLTYTPEKQYNSVVVSTPDVVIDNEYTLTLGSESQSAIMTELIYGSGNEMGGQGMHGGRDGNSPGENMSGQPPEGKRPIMD